MVGRYVPENVLVRRYLNFTVAGFLAICSHNLRRVEEIYEENGNLELDFFWPESEKLKPGMELLAANLYEPDPCIMRIIREPEYKMNTVLIAQGFEDGVMELIEDFPDVVGMEIVEPNERLKIFMDHLFTPTQKAPFKYFEEEDIPEKEAKIIYANSIRVIRDKYWSAE